MTRKRASRDKIEEMLLEKIRAHPGCEKANHVSIYLVEGSPNWRIANYNAEATESAVSAAFEYVASQYDLAEEDE
jgi:hypothetical protein